MSPLVPEFKNTDLVGSKSTRQAATIEEWHLDCSYTQLRRINLSAQHRLPLCWMRRNKLKIRRLKSHRPVAPSKQISGWR